MTSLIQSSLGASKAKRRRSFVVGSSAGRAMSPWRLSKRWTVAGAKTISGGTSCCWRAVAISIATLKAGCASFRTQSWSATAGRQARGLPAARPGRGGGEPGGGGETGRPPGGAGGKGEGGGGGAGGGAPRGGGAGPATEIGQQGHDREQRRPHQRQTASHPPHRRRQHDVRAE